MKANRTRERRGAPTAVFMALCLAATIAAESRRSSGPDAVAISRAAAKAPSQQDAQPLSFEENRGQADSRVRYLSRARDYAVALTDDAVLLLVPKPAAAHASPRRHAADMALLRMRLAGSSRTPRITAHDPLPGKVYYAEASARGPLTPIDTFARVEYADIYPGIDLVYYGNDRQLEFDFVVAPFADPDRIALSLDGADRITLTEGGDLAVRVSGTDITLKRPIVYQDGDEGRVEIAGAYVLPANGTGAVRLSLGEYDPSLPLVIDPTWLTVFGSTSEDLAIGFEVDPAGHPRLLGLTFDPASFPNSDIQPGVLPPPNCFLAKFDPATSLRIYTILFMNTSACETLALSPQGVAYFTGFVFPNGFPNNQGTTVTAVDDSSGVPLVSRFVVGNYDSSAVGEGVDALAVNNVGHVFLLGPCRLVDTGEPGLELSGYNETPDLPQGTFDEGCTPQSPGFTTKLQAILTVVDSSGTFLYGSFLSPGEHATTYALAADDAGRAYIMGAQSSTIAATGDAYRSSCPTAGTRGFDSCGYLMVLDTTTTGPSSLLYASYLWNTENLQTLAIRLGPTGQVYIASDGGVFDDFPSNRPSNPVGWPYSMYPALRDGVQLARFNRDATSEMPNALDFALVFDPSRAVAALAGQTVRDELAGVRLFSSGALAVGSIAFTPTSTPLGIVTTFLPDADGVGPVWTQNLGSRSPVVLHVATDSPGNLFMAGQLDDSSAQFSDVFVEQIEGADPAANQPPTVRFMFPLHQTTVPADSPSGATIFLAAIASDPDGDPVSFSWSGPFIDNPVTTDMFLTARLALGAQQTITVTVDDGRGGTASASVTLDVFGMPFSGTAATPVDSAFGSQFLFTYTPVTVTAADMPPAGSLVFLKTRVDRVPGIPSDLQAGSPPMYFDVSTNAAAMATPIDVCIDTRGMSFPEPSSIRLYHHKPAAAPGGWIDITTSVNPGANQVCGRTDGLGTFAIFYPQVPVTAIRTIAGNGVQALTADEFVPGPAASTPLAGLLGGAYDRARNLLYVSESTGFILRVDLSTNTITRVAGNGVFFLGSLPDPADLRDDLIDGGDAFATFVGLPRELVVNPAGDVVFHDAQTCRIRRLDLVQSKIFNVAGNGSCGFGGDGQSALNAALAVDGPMAFDAAGNLFIVQGNHGRVRRIDGASGTIATAAGDGTFVNPTNGAPALSTIGFPRALAFDAQGYLVVANGNSSLLRISPGTDGLVRGDGDAGETISVIAGCHIGPCQQPFAGDGLPITHREAYFTAPQHVGVAPDGALILWDSFRIRRVAPGADGIVTGAADEIVHTIGGYHDPNSSGAANFNGDTFATQSLLGAGNFVVQDDQGRVIIVDGGNYRVRAFGFVGSGEDTGADLAVSATASRSETSIGLPVRFTVRVTNNGPASGSSVTLAMSPPNGFRLDSVQGPVVCALPGGTDPVSCDVGTLTVGQQLSFTFDATPLAEGVMSATFTVSAQESDATSGNDTATVEVDVLPAADLAVSIVAPANGAVANVGSPLTFDVVMSNLGPSSAFTARLRLPLPANLEFVSASIPGGACDPQAAQGGLVLCDVDALAVGASPHATIVLRPTAAGPISGTFEVSSPLFDPTQANNTAAFTLTTDVVPVVINVAESIVVTDAATVRPAALIGVSETIVVSDTPVVRPAVMIGVSETIVVTDSPVVTPAAPDMELFFAEPINPIRVENGFQLSFHIALANRGTTPFLGPLPVSGTLPVGVTLSFLPPFCSATTAREYTCTYLDFATSPLPPGSVTGFSIGATVGNVAVPGGPPVTLTTSATLTAPGDPNPQNNTDSIEFTVTDVTPPVISACAPPLTVWSNLAGQAAIPDMRSAVQATDNWPGSLTILQDPPAGTIVGVGTHPVEIFVYDAQQNGNICQTSVVVQRPAVTLNLPGNVTLVASGPNGAAFPYQVTATDGPVTFEPFCTPQLFPGMFFPIGTTTVSCIAFGPVSLSAATGSFTVTVVVGAPKLSVAVGPIFRQLNGNYLVNLFVTNIGTGHARNVTLTSLKFRTLAGTGTVSFNAAISGSLPKAVGPIDAGQGQTVGLFLEVPPTVVRYSITEGITLQNVLGVGFSVSAGQTIIR